MSLNQTTFLNGYQDNKLPRLDQFQQVILLPDENNLEKMQKIVDENTKTILKNTSTSLLVSLQSYKEKTRKISQVLESNDELKEMIKKDEFFYYLMVEAKHVDFQIILLDETTNEAIIWHPLASNQKILEFFAKNDLYNQQFWRDLHRHTFRFKDMFENDLENEKNKILFESSQEIEKLGPFGEFDRYLMFEICTFLGPFDVMIKISILDKESHDFSFLDSLWKSMTKGIVLKTGYFRIENEKTFDNEVNKEKLPWMLFYRQYVQPLLLDAKMIELDFKAKMNTQLLQKYPEFANSWKINSRIFQKSVLCQILFI